MWEFGGGDSCRRRRVEGGDSYRGGEERGKFTCLEGNGEGEAGETGRG